MIRLIGDVHGKFDEYINIAKDADYSIQLGDMGFDYSKLYALNPSRHKFIGGNHDNYDLYKYSKHSLGEYGVCYVNNVKFFFVRGAFSIDCLGRLRSYAVSGAKTWWYEEELNMQQMSDALELYSKVKPDIIITHSAPTSVKNLITKPHVMKHFGWDENHNSNTQMLLEAMFNEHQPESWYFGHFHLDWKKKIGKTEFTCLNELSYEDI